MKRYLIFINTTGTGQYSTVGSPEYVACEIASLAGRDSLPAQYFIAHAENTPEATFAVLKGSIRLSLVLDQAGIDLWLEELKPISDQLENVQDSIDQAYCSIIDAVSNLGSRCQSSQHFSDVNLAAEITFQSAFDNIENDSAYQFFNKVSELYEIQHYQIAD
jgi:hypothetical protein